MIKILLHFFSDICVTDADCLFQAGIEPLLDDSCVVFQEGPAKILQFFRIGVKIPVGQFLADIFLMLFPLISCSISFLSDVFALLKNLLIMSLLLVFTQ